MATDGTPVARELPRGVWRRANWDWAYRVEIEGVGSVAGVGFSSRDEAREAMKDARLDLLKREGLARVQHTDWQQFAKDYL